MLQKQQRVPRQKNKRRQRHSFLLLYLLGASPAVCACFLAGRQHGLQSLSGNTLYQPHATSLRMSRLGYQNTVQRDLHVSYNRLDHYIRDLGHAIHTSYPAFERLGVKKAEQAGRPVFALLGAAENLQIRYPDSAHDFPPEVRQEAYALIDCVLEHARK